MGGHQGARDKGSRGGKETREVVTKSLGRGADGRREKLGKIDRKAGKYSGTKEAHEGRNQNRQRKIFDERKCHRDRDGGSREVGRQRGLAAPAVGDEGKTETTDDSSAVQNACDQAHLRDDGPRPATLAS